MAGLAPCANICSRAALNFGKAGMRKLGTDKKINMMMVMVVIIRQYIFNVVIERQNYVNIVFPSFKRNCFPPRCFIFHMQGKQGHAGKDCIVCIFRSIHSIFIEVVSELFSQLLTSVDYDQTWVW